MKKNYLILASIFTSVLAFGQIHNSKVNTGKNNVQSSSKTVNNVVAQKGGSSSLWENDFSAPADWAFVVNGSAPHNWVIGTGVPSGDFAISGINSTTKLNGFALFDSDLQCGAAGSQNSDVRNVTPIDLSANPNVKLTFQSWYRAYQGSCHVIASTDGVTWTEIEIYSELNGNDFLPSNPTTTSVNLSAVIGNSSTAYIGFRYKGGCDYAWMVDDVKLEIVPDNDLAVSKTWSGDVALDLDYSMVPVAQTKPMIAGAIISNNGVLPQTGVNAVLKVMQGGSEVYTQTDTRDYTPGEVDTVWFTTTFTPTALGEYTVEVTIPEDDLIGNETGTASLTLTNYIYGQDYLGAGTTSRAETEEHAFATSFFMTENASLMGIQVEFEAGTTANQEIVVKVLNFEDFSFVAEKYYTVTNTQIGPNKTTNILLDAPVDLVADQGYVLAVFKQAGPSELELGASLEGNDDGFSCFIYGPFSASSSDPDWFLYNDVPAIRANFDPSLSVSTLVDVKGVNVYPNPSEGIVTISNDLNAENTITVTDMTGKVVLTKVSSSATAVDLSKVGTGVYMVEVSNENGKKVERVVIR